MALIPNISGKVKSIEPAEGKYQFKLVLIDCWLPGLGGKTEHDQIVWLPGPCDGKEGQMCSIFAFQLSAPNEWEAETHGYWSH